jgi:hypothetical protein
MSERHKDVVGVEGTGKTPTVELARKAAAGRTSEHDSTSAEPQLRQSCNT